MLQDRERRADKIAALLESAPGHVVIAGRVNYPGDDKCNPMALAAFQVLQQLLLAAFEEAISRSTLLTDADGYTFLAVISDHAEYAKLKAVAIEANHPLGRLFDIDVYAKEGAVSRTALSQPPRQCILCDMPAKICIAGNRHHRARVIAVFHQTVVQYLQKEI
jgi:holo-ACP synthase CitX